jgi:hypothetical protein
VTLPTYLQNLPSRNLAQTAIANIGAGNPPYLSIQGGRFTLVDVAGNTIPIQQFHVDVVIIDVNEHISKIFFGLDKPYDPNNPTPPLCFSDNGLAPSTAAGQPQAPTCAACPQNVWGSKISQMGSAVKQCADQQKISIYVPEYSDGLFLLRIPPGSFANWRAYMAKFAGAKLDPDRVLTRISFEQGAVGTLVFQSPGYITEAMAGVVGQMIESRASDQLIGRLDRPREGVVMRQPAAIAAPVQPQRQRKPRGRPAAAQAQPGQTQPQQAPFREQPAQPAQPDQAPFPLENPPSGGQAQFGLVQNPPAPPPGLDLDAVFK